MSLDKATVLHIARLARIALGADEVEPLAAELSSILAWIEELNEVDTEAVAPMTSVVEMRLPRRADEVTDGAPVENVIRNAPEKSDSFFVVPKVVG
ncbi:MAG: Asp-tRNA(Asn)/Glu-tRNA(Gln) amidotransferase subunit GatC [Alphaproteobacteria bacterium]|nr:Asp-tRNA(Asn)/Glu-tRNA(Gln) amidotransferase subunit GatC [Pseudomonadota bacterium]